MLTCGIDPSFSNTGIAIVNDKIEVVDWDSFSFTSKIGDFDRIDLRCKKIIDNIIDFIKRNNKEKLSVFIEIPLGTLYGYANNLRVEFWFIVHFIDTAFKDIDIYAVPQSTLTKWVTGSNRTSAANKASIFFRKYSHLLPEQLKDKKRKNRDIWDAIALAVIGQQVLGSNVEIELNQIDIARNIKKLHKED